MAKTNFEALMRSREQEKTRESGGHFQKVTYLKVTRGKPTVFFVLPEKTGDPNAKWPFEYLNHAKVPTGDGMTRSFVCAGKGCPICQSLKALDANDRNKKMMGARTRCLINVLDVTDMTVKVLDLTKRESNLLIDLIIDQNSNEDRDITDVSVNRPVELTRLDGTANGGDWGGFKVLNGNKLNISVSQALVDQIKQGDILFDLDKVKTVLTPEELTQSLNGETPERFKKKNHDVEAGDAEAVAEVHKAQQRDEIDAMLAQAPVSPSAPPVAEPEVKAQGNSELDDLLASIGG